MFLISKADFPSYVGIIEESVDKTDTMDTDSIINKENNPIIKDGDEKRDTKRYIFDTMGLRAVRENKEIKPLLKAGLIEDWDLIEKALDYTFNKHLRCDSSKHPILMSEPVTNTKQKREKLCEIIFEKFNAPGFYISPNGVLSAFANNRTSGLVLDCGATHTTAIPIHDGYVLNKAIAQSPLGGEFIITKARQFIEEQLNVEIVPYYQVKSKVRNDYMNQN
jgi:actin-related protein